jgi:single-strand DNA-binding protein
LNRVVLIGRLTKDPELRYTAENQTPVAKFTIAVDRTFKREGQQEADFIPVVVFGKVAENVGRFMKKGRLVAVGGRIQTGSYTDQEGKKRYTTDVIADEVQFLDKGNSNAPSAGGDFGGGYSGDDFHPVDENDDLPF